MTAEPSQEFYEHDILSPRFPMSAPTPKKSPLRQLAFFEERVEQAPASAKPPTAEVDSSDQTSRLPQVAPWSFGGYLYQLRYAAVKSLELDVGEAMGVELLDDVHIEGPPGQLTIHQVKAQQEPLTDRSRGLWRALAYWASQPIVNMETATLIFATTAPIHPGLPLMLSRDESSQGERFQYVVQNFRPRSKKEANSDIQKVMSLDSSRLRALLTRIRVIRSASEEDMLVAMKKLLRRRTFRNEHIESAAQEYEGWIIQMLLHEFRLGEGVRISDDDVMTILQTMRDSRAPGRIRFRHGQTNPTAEEKATYRERTFFQQLECIKLPAQALDAALIDFLRNQRERAEWAQHPEVTPSDLRDYEGELYNQWNHRFMDLAGTREGRGEIENGRMLYDEVLRCVSPRLRDQSPPCHVFRGSYHSLADERRLGWHPRWHAFFGHPIEDDVDTCYGHVQDEAQ